MTVNLKAAEKLIHIARDVIVGETGFLAMDEDFDEVMSAAVLHKIENILFYAVKNPEQALIDLNAKGIFIEANQEEFSRLIMDAFESEGIEHMLLKGGIIKNLYPLPDMRQSADIDIWISPDKAEESKKIMTELGFDVVNFGIDNDDEYCFNNMIYVELHKQLISKKFRWGEVCSSIVDNRKPEPGYNYRYRMTDEDFYVFMLIHMAKHILYGGAGIRLVLDVWIYLRRCQMDNEKLQARLEEADISLFDRQIRRLCDYWFDGGETNDMLVIQLSEYMINSGWNGTSEQVKMTDYMRNVQQNNSGVKRYIKSIFWSKEMMEKRYPILNKYPFLLPAMWVHRIFKAVFIKKGTVSAIAHYYDDVKTDEIDSFKTFTKYIGL